MPSREVRPFMNRLIREHQDRARQNRRDSKPEHNELMTCEAPRLRLWLRRRLESQNTWNVHERINFWTCSAFGNKAVKLTDRKACNGKSL